MEGDLLIERMERAGGLIKVVRKKGKHLLRHGIVVLDNWTPLKDDFVHRHINTKMIISIVNPRYS